MELEAILSPDEILEIGDAMEKMTDPQLRETLEELVRREVALLSNPHLGEDSEMREITRWNIAALCAASTRIDPKQPDAGPNEP